MRPDLSTLHISALVAIRKMHLVNPLLLWREYRTDLTASRTCTQYHQDYVFHDATIRVIMLVTILLFADIFF